MECDRNMGIKQWLADHCNLEEYASKFIDNGFENIALLEHIDSIALNYNDDEDIIIIII